MKQKDNVEVNQTKSYFCVTKRSINSLVIPKVLCGKFSHGNGDVQIIQGTIEGAFGIITTVPGGTWRRRPPCTQFHAFSPLISSSKVKTMVVWACRWLGDILWEKTRAPPNGAKQPTWWKSISGEVTKLVKELRARFGRGKNRGVIFWGKISSFHLQMWNNYFSKRMHFYSQY